MDEAITCTACRLSIRGGDERRTHYRSDLHRVNLKRKVTGLGPLSESELLGRINALQEQRKPTGREKQACELCRKKFSSRKALENHINSRRHRDALMKMDMSFADSDSVAESEGGVHGMVEEVDEDDMDEELDRRMKDWRGEEGVFSGVFDETWHENGVGAWQHCKSQHEFFVPYEEFVKDWDALMGYIGQKVGIGYACISCDRGFGSSDAARRHMKDVGHCRMGDDWVEEFGEFYRWNEEDDKDGWVEVDEKEVDEAAEEVAEGETEDDNSTGGADVVGRIDGGEEDEVGLVLGGKVVGHRSLTRYYRQGAGRSEDLRVGVLANRGAMQGLRAIGWKKLDRQSVESSRMAVRQRAKFELVVGGQNYYTRKARFKQKMAVFNSGYRA